METPYPFANYYGPVKTPYGDLLPSYKPLRPVNRFYGPLQELFRPLRTTLYSMADISKQVSEG